MEHQITEMGEYLHYFVIDPSYSSLSSFAQHYDYDLLGQPISNFRYFMKRPLAVIRGFLVNSELILKCTTVFLILFILFMGWLVDHLPGIWHRINVMMQIISETIKSHQETELSKQESGYQTADNYAAAAYRAHTGLQQIVDQLQTPIPASLNDYEMVRFVSESNWIKGRTNERLAYANREVNREFPLVYPIGKKFSEVRDLADHRVKDEEYADVTAKDQGRQNISMGRKKRAPIKRTLMQKRLFKFIDHGCLEKRKPRNISDSFENQRSRHISPEIPQPVEEEPLNEELHGTKKAPLTPEERRLAEMAGWVLEYRKRQEEAASELRSAKQFIKCRSLEKKPKLRYSEIKELASIFAEKGPVEEVPTEGEAEEDSLNSFRATPNYFSFQDSPRQEFKVTDSSAISQPSKKIPVQRLKRKKYDEMNCESDVCKFNYE